MIYIRLKILKNIYEPQHDKTNKMTCVQASEDSDQLYTHWVAKDPMFLHAVKTLIRLGGCPGWSESSLGAHHFVAFVVLWLIFVCHY